MNKLIKKEGFLISVSLYEHLLDKNYPIRELANKIYEYLEKDNSVKEFVFHVFTNNNFIGKDLGLARNNIKENEVNAYYYDPKEKEVECNSGRVREKEREIKNLISGRL